MAWPEARFSPPRAIAHFGYLRLAYDATLGLAMEDWRELQGCLRDLLVAVGFHIHVLDFDKGDWT